jgi:hypothetical protein
MDDKRKRRNSEPLFAQRGASKKTEVTEVAGVTE